MGRLADLPDELVVAVLAWLNAQTLAVAASVSSTFGRLLCASVEARMERLGSPWPTLLPEESPAWALQITESLGTARHSW
eukprot:3416656-Prymnesium_polylepis.1